MSVHRLQLTIHGQKSIFLLFCLLLFVGMTWAQTPDSTDDQQLKGIVFDNEEPDSVLKGKVFQFHLDPLQVKIQHIDHPTLNPAGTQYHDPLETLNGDYYLSRGLVGQSHISIFPKMVKPLRWSYQPDINAGYAKRPDNVVFYQTQTPFTSLSYQSSIKRAYQVNVIHTQNITPRWNIALDYHLINPEGIYSNSDVLSHYLDATTNYYSRDSRYQLYAGVIWQKLKIDENGGILNDELFTQRRQNNFAGIPVRFIQGGSLFNTLDLFTHQTFNFVRQTQTVKERQELIVSQTDSNKLDTIFHYDTILPQTPHTINPGVVGLNLAMQRNARKFIDSTTTHYYSGEFFWSNDAYVDSRWRNPLKVRGGVKPQLVHVNENNENTFNFFNTSLFADVLLHIGKADISAQAERVNSSNYTNGDYTLNANLNLQFDSLTTMDIAATLQGRAPDYFFYHYNSNGRTWDCVDLNKISTKQLQLDFNRENFFHFTAAAQQIGNHVWLEGDTSALAPVQGTQSFWLFQGRLNMQLQLWGWLHYDMQQMVQYSTDEQQLRVPLFASKNSLYTNIYLFKRALRAQFGVDIRYHTLFYADSYSPEAGAFYHQDEYKVGNYLWADVFINLQIKHASIYAKAGHLNSIWEPEARYMLFPHNPGINFGVYYGVIWKFFD